MRGAMRYSMLAKVNGGVTSCAVGKMMGTTSDSISDVWFSNAKM
jgi:hypothetical protein